MANTYNIGGSINQITLQADIISIGVAGTRASILDLASANPGIAVAHSTDATGNISKQSIGNYTTLKGKQLTVFTQIALLGSDAPTRVAEAPTCAGTYTISGGDNGVQTFNDPTNTYIDPFVYLTFVVDLT